jgi:hypothetical protein
MRKILIGSVLALVALAAPARADQCDNWLATMRADITSYNAAFDRLPTPMPYTDAAICRASEKFIADWKMFNQFEIDHGQCASDRFEDALTEALGHKHAAQRDFHCQ